MTKALVHSELQKLRSNRTFWIMAAILVAFSVFYVFMQTDIYFKTDQTLLQMMGMSNDLVKEGPTIFWKIIRDSSMVSWFSVPFAGLFVLVLSIYPVGAFLRCCLPWIQVMSAADAAYFWQGVSLKLILDLHFISIGFFLVFLCRDVLKSIAASLGAYSGG